MPTRAKRKPDFDPNRSDSEDETYGTSASKPMRSKSSKHSTSKPRKRQRRKYGDDDDDEDDEDDDDSIEDDSIEEPEEDEEVEVGPSGRPRRGAAPKNFQESSEEEEDEIKDEDSEGQGEGEEDEEEEIEEEDVKLPKRQKRKIITLRGTPGIFPTSGGRRRSTRHGSASATPT